MHTHATPENLCASARVLVQLYRCDIVDVGALVPDRTVGFLEGCSFGPDPEESTVMMLTPEGERRWREPGWEFVPRPGLRELLLRV